jgi:hypothetical protein
VTSYKEYYIIGDAPIDGSVSGVCAINPLMVSYDLSYYQREKKGRKGDAILFLKTPHRMDVTKTIIMLLIENLFKFEPYNN